MTPILALTRTAHREAAALAASAGDRYLTHQIARQLGHDPKWALSPSREAKYVQARAEVAQVLRELGWSYPRIGRAIGRGHSDVMFLLGASKRGRERLARATPAHVPPSNVPPHSHRARRRREVEGLGMARGMQ
jgi:hypothetical protein